MRSLWSLDMLARRRDPRRTILTTERRLAGEAGILLALLLLLVTAFARQPVLLLIAAVLLAIAGVTALWRHFCLAGLDYRRRFSQPRAFLGETLDFSVQVENRKLLPVPWLEIEDELPDGLTLTGGSVHVSVKPLRLLLRTLLSLQPYERVTRRYKLQAAVRGYHLFGPVRLQSGDLFGFFSAQTVLEREDRLLVYPRVVPLADLGLPARQPFGGRRTPLKLLDDPLRIAGVREYQSGDSLKQIHWKATARTRELQVKLQEPSTALDLLLFLNVGTLVPEWQGSIPELLEEAITVAASLASQAFQDGCRVGLYVNTNAAGSDQQVKLPPSGSPDQLTRILEALAMIIGFPTITMDRFLQAEARSLPWGATVVLVSAATSDAALAALLRLKRAGRRVSLVHVGDRPLPAAVAGIEVLRASTADSAIAQSSLSVP